MGQFQFSISIIFIAINVILFFVTSNDPNKLQRMLFISNRVRYHKEYDRLFLSGFIHAGILHLLFNCMTLYFFGPALEAEIGRPLFLILYLVSIIGGNVYCLFMRKEEHNYSALGASGGVLGVIFGFILISPFSRISLFILPVMIPAWIFGIIFTITSIVLTQLRHAEGARISHEGHLGGALFGALIVFFSGMVDFEYMEVIYFLIGGVAPIALFALVKLIAPKLIYRHLQ